MRTVICRQCRGSFPVSDSARRQYCSEDCRQARRGECRKRDSMRLRADPAYLNRIQKRARDWYHARMADEAYRKRESDKWREYYQKNIESVRVVRKKHYIKKKAIWDYIKDLGIITTGELQ